MGLSIDGETLNLNILLFIDYFREAQQMLRVLNKASIKLGLTINFDKIELMTNLVFNTSHCRQHKNRARWSVQMPTVRFLEKFKIKFACNSKYLRLNKVFNKVKIKFQSLLLFCELLKQLTILISKLNLLNFYNPGASTFCRCCKIYEVSQLGFFLYLTAVSCVFSVVSQFNVLRYQENDKKLYKLHNLLSSFFVPSIAIRICSKGLNDILLSIFTKSFLLILDIIFLENRVCITVLCRFTAKIFIELWYGHDYCL